MFQSLTLPTNHSLRSPFPSLRRDSLRCKASVQTFPVTAGRNPASLYEVLRVNDTASVQEIKSAYRSLAKMYHPDARIESDGRDFIQIHNAYETLSDPSTRCLYDLSLGLGNRDRRSGLSSVAVAASSYGFYTVGTRRWETDQCW